MTGSWLTLSAAAARIEAATGEPTSMDDVLELGRQDLLIVVWQHEHYSVLEESVTDYLALRDDEHAGRDEQSPVVERWSRADDPDAFAERSDYDDTPNDEGDEQQ